MSKWMIKIVDGFRVIDCPICGKTVSVLSWPDDTRWRYARHAGPDGEECDYSQELLSKEPS